MSPTAKTLKLLMLGPVLIGLFGLLFLSAAPVARAQAVNARCLCYFRVDDANFKDEIGKYCQVVTPVSEPGADQGLSYCNLACPNDVGLRIDKKYYDVSFINQLFIADPSTAPTAEKNALAECEQRSFSGVQTDPNAEIKIVPYQTPQLAVPIPGLSFSEPLRKGNKLSIDFIGEYFSSVYQWLIGASLTIAIVMVMIGGLQYVLSAGRGDAGEAKTRISNAVIGFVLLLGTYAILYTVNPELTLLRPVIVQQVASAPGLPFGEGEENSISGLAPPADLRNAAGANILNPKPAGSLITQEAAQAVEQAAGNLNGKNYGLYISSGYRSVEKQIALIRQNCQNEPGSATCNRKPNRPSTCILKNLDPKNCPHTTARAVDIWAAEKYEDKWIPCISQKECLGDLSACFANACQATLIAEMKAQGFCVLSSEPWHFEKPKMSTTCK